ncbi:MAG: energy-coupling factor transporter transmembrane protein EcfT [Desulfobacter sp.]|nr:energy-coupling factor transporter transmembrane protein EcfT [Desulfobacter sp.]WDP85503.1 MAG: energy-coupling factor transporter transmembrane protein EcfT [Desulfobacter sp.]
MPHLFEFKSGTSLFHTLDPRSKLFVLAYMSMGIISAQWAGCLITLALVFCFILHARIPMGPQFGQLKYFFLLLAIIILVRGTIVPGQALFWVWGHPITRQGLNQGGLVATRFFLIMEIGIIFSSTTRPSELKAAVQWVLKPVPMVPEKQAGMIISLALRFFPLILAQAQETGQTIQARCGKKQKNPLKRIQVFCLALLGKTFKSADGLAMAMEARSYTENRTDPEFCPSGDEPLALLLGSGFFLLLLFF